MIKQIEKMMYKEDIAYCEIVNLETWERMCRGDRERISPDGLIRMNEEENDLKGLYRCTKKQPLPQHWRQGDVKMLVCLPRENLMVMFYYYVFRELKDEIKRGERFDAELKRIVYQL